MQRSPVLEKLISDWFAAATRGDAALVDELISGSAGTCLIGSDPSEWLRGGADVAGFLRGDVVGSGGQARLVPADVEAYEEGSVGWGSARLTFTLPDGSSVRPRWSAVWHREGDWWRFVQTHASLGVGNQEAGWTYEGGEAETAANLRSGGRAGRSAGGRGDRAADGRRGGPRGGRRADLLPCR